MTVIVAAIDDSAAATPVLDTARALAPVLAADVHAVHVADKLGLTATASARAATVPLHLLAGDPIDQLLAMTADDNVVAIVLGARGRRTGPRPAGRVALAVANGTPKPVFIVPPDVRAPGRVRRVLIAMEGTTRKGRALQRAVTLAAAAQLEVVVVHVDDETTIPHFSDQLQYETEVYASEFLARNCPGAPLTRLELRVGVPADEILLAADLIKPDVLALGWPQTDEPGRGLVARDVINRCHLPVLLVALAA